MLTKKGTGILREKNKRMLLSLLRELKKSSRQDLAKYMDVSKNTVSLIVDELLQDGLIQEIGMIDQSGKGRPKIKIEMNHEAYQSVGFVVHSTLIECSVVDYYSFLLNKKTIRCDSRNPDVVKAVIINEVQQLQKQYEGILGIGIGFPGIVNTYESVIYQSTHLGWDHVSVFADLDKILALPVFIQNSVNMAALNVIDSDINNEEKSVFYIRIREGVGGAFIYNGNVINGASWTAGEIGHIPVDYTADVCKCGQRGCLEHLISLTALNRDLKRLGIDHSVEEMISMPAKDMPYDLCLLLQSYGKHLGVSMILIMHLLNPNMIYIDAPYSDLSDFKQSFYDYVRSNALNVPLKNTEIIFGNNYYVPSIGAALSVILHYENLDF